MMYWSSENRIFHQVSDMVDPVDGFWDGFLYDFTTFWDSLIMITFKGKFLVKPPELYGCLMMIILMIMQWTIIDYMTGWWYTYPSEKYEFASWDDEIPNIWKKNMFQTTNQL